MRNPHYWIGRRITRAAAAFVPASASASAAAAEGAAAATEAPPDAEAPPDDAGRSDAADAGRSPPASAASAELLADQLRQLRRQQAQLSSHDPPAVGESFVLHEIYRVLPSFTEFYRVLPSFTEFLPS